jgi:hypothetical protein
MVVLLVYGGKPQTLSPDPYEHHTSLVRRSIAQTCTGKWKYINNGHCLQYPNPQRHVTQELMGYTLCLLPAICGIVVRRSLKAGKQLGKSGPGESLRGMHEIANIANKLEV